MIITENEGLNLNSPIVQNMISFWPKEKLDRTKFYYGRSPTVESVGESIYDEQVKEEIDQISYAEMEEQSMKPGYDYNDSPIDAIREVNNSQPRAILTGLPVHEFTGALRPSYYDFNQPTGYIPTSAPVQYGYQSTMSNQAYQNSYQNKYGGNPYYNQNYSGLPGNTIDYNQGPWVSRDAGNYKIAMIEEMPAPQSVVRQGNGTVYMRELPKMYDLAVQPDPYISVPSEAYLAQIEKESNMFSGYQNPYMQNGAYYNKSYRINEAYRQARHNYAVYYGFESVEELDANDNAIMKTISLMAHAAVGDSEELTKKIIEKVYEEPFNRMYKKEENSTQNLSYASVQRDVQAYANERKRKRHIIKVKLMKGDKVIAESENDDQEISESEKFNMALQAKYQKDYEESEIRRKAIIAHIYANAPERKFDNFSLVNFFNTAFYELHDIELREVQRKQNAKKIKQRYHQGDFKREVLRKFGKPALRNRLEEEDYRFRKSDPVEEGKLRGSYGYKPSIIRDGIEIKMPLNPESDPRLGYCFTYDTRTGQLEPKYPRNDEELMLRKNRFLRAAGYEVPIYASTESRQYH